LHAATHSRIELWQPRYYKSWSREEWEKKGKQDLIDIIDEDLQEILAAHRPEPLADNVKKHIDDILIKYGVIKP